MREEEDFQAAADLHLKTLIDPVSFDFYLCCVLIDYTRSFTNIVSQHLVPDADQSWKELHEELDVKPEYLKPEQAVLAMATACDYGDRISTHILKVHSLNITV